MDLNVEVCLFHFFLSDLFIADLWWCVLSVYIFMYNMPILV